jgi:hypothetical protein
MAAVATFGTVHDLRDSIPHRKRDVDFRLCLASGCEVDIEVKVDSYAESGNLAFETVSNVSKKTPGCLLYTEAHAVAYLYVATGELLLLPVAQMRENLVPLLTRYPQRMTGTGAKTLQYPTLLRKVPLTAVFEHVPDAVWCHAYALADSCLAQYQDYRAASCSSGVVKGDWPERRQRGASQTARARGPRLRTRGEFKSWLARQPAPGKADPEALTELVAREFLAQAA